MKPQGILLWDQEIRKIVSTLPQHCGSMSNTIARTAIVRCPHMRNRARWSTLGIVLPPRAAPHGVDLRSRAKAHVRVGALAQRFVECRVGRETLLEHGINTPSLVANHFH